MAEEAAKMLPTATGSEGRGLSTTMVSLKRPASMIFVALTNSIAGFESVAPDAKR